MAETQRNVREKKPYFGSLPSNVFPERKPVSGKAPFKEYFTA